MTTNMPRVLQGPAPAVALARLSDFAIRAGGFSVGFLAGFLVFHLLMYYFAFVPDALDAESLIREVAAMSERESRTTA